MGARLVVAVVLLATAGSHVVGEEPVRVYTNADLEALEPLPVSDPANGGDGDLGWEFVNEFIEREHRRIDAERSWDLDRRAADLDQASRTRYDSPYRGLYYGVPWSYPSYGTHGRRDTPRVRDVHGLRGDIRPLHAGPTQAQRHRARAIRDAGSGGSSRRPD